ncbi:MAG: efflux RND transporter periplasmic adaptor subunit, partial [Patescibacteria group bacterium]
VSAEVGNIEEEVLVTGSTKSSSTVNLGFERSGKVVQAGVEVGDKVPAGAVLAVLDQSTLRANLAKANANLAEEEVRLGTITRTSSATYQNVYDSALLSIKDVYNKAENAVNNEADQFFYNAHDFSPQFGLSGTQNDGINYPFNNSISAAKRQDLANERRDIELVMHSWQTSIQRIQSGQDLAPAIAEAEKNLSTIKTFLDHLASAVNSVSVYNNYTYQSEVDAYKATAGSARTEVSAALSTLISTKDKLANAPTRSTTDSGTTYTDVLSEQARIESLKADVQAIQADLDKTVLTAPISGVVTKAEAKRGEIVTAGAPLITIISDAKLQVEANVSEVNIGRVKIGDRVSITFDAFPDKEYIGAVAYIDPGQTLVDGVATYKVTVRFADVPEAELRSGLTANLRIQTANKEGVVKIPAYAVEKTGNRSFVRIMDGEDEVEKDVTLGLKGKDGTIEVISGLSGTEKLVVSEK